MRRAMATLAAVVLLAGCGSSDDGLTQAVTGYVAAFGQGDGTAAWELVSSRCRENEPRDQYETAVRAAGDLYSGIELDGEVDTEMDGDSATVSYNVSDPTLNQTRERWILEGDDWRWDDC